MRDAPCVYMARMKEHPHAPFWMDGWVVEGMKVAPYIYIYMARMKQHQDAPFLMAGWLDE
jgi:hypothetical protein